MQAYRHSRVQTTNCPSEDLYWVFSSKKQHYLNILMCETSRGWKTILGEIVLFCFVRRYCYEQIETRLLTVYIVISYKVQETSERGLVVNFNYSCNIRL